MMKYKYVSCVNWLGLSITFYHFFWILASPSLEAKITEFCKPLNESEGEPGLACKCGEDPFHSLSYVIKRYSYNMTCIDCPPGYYYEFEVFDCRPCPQPNHNCFKQNNARRDCISCDAMESPSRSSQGSTTETPTTPSTSEKPVKFSMVSTPTILPTTREPNSRDLFETTSPAPSTTSLLTPMTSEATKKRTKLEPSDLLKSRKYGTIFAITIFFSFVLVAIIVAFVWWYGKRGVLNANEDAQRNGGVSHLEMIELIDR